MEAFDDITIIYNPMSTGEAPQLAAKFQRSLEKDGYASSLTPTKYAGHAVKLARDLTTRHKRPLIISVSGDGGYNEVIRGAMEAKESKPSARPVCAVIAAGNANDHKRVTRGDTALITLLRRGAIKPLDILQLRAEAPGFSLTSYAHSYIGFGMTPLVGKQLNRQGKGFIGELRALTTTLADFKPFPAVINGKRHLYNNILCGNINEMAKVIKLHQSVTLTDGKFEVIAMRHHSMPGMLFQAARAAIFGVQQSQTVSSFTIHLPEAEPVQQDGEITELPADCRVIITSRPSAIDSLY